MASRRDPVTRILGFAMQLALGAILILVFLLVVLRYAFHTTIIGGNEATLIAFVFSSVIAAAIALREDDHIAIRYFAERLSPGKQRLVAILRWALLAANNLVLFVYAIAWIAKTGRYMMPALGLPQWIAQISIPLGCGLGAVYAAARCWSVISRRSDSGDN